MACTRLPTAWFVKGQALATMCLVGGGFAGSAAGKAKALDDYGYTRQIERCQRLASFRLSLRPRLVGLMKGTSPGGLCAMEMLKTPAQIRRQLGEDYNHIKNDFDRHKEDRAKTKRAAQKACREAEACAICGQKPDAKGLRLEWAHIIGLQECGETEPANLLPLCRRPDRKGWQPDRLGCHQLYDLAPSATPAEVFRAQKLWCAGKSWPELRQDMEKRSRDFFRQADSGSEELARLIAASRFKQADDLCRELLEGTLDASDRFWWQMKLVEVCRRRGRLGQLEEAERQWTELERTGPPPQWAPFFFYEGGYIRLLLGQHEEAHQQFRQVSALQPTSDTAGIWVSSVSLIVQMLVAIYGSAAPWDQVMDLVSQASNVCLQFENYDTRRWIDNLNWRKVLIELVRGRQDRYEDAWKKAEDQSLILTNRMKWDPLGFGVKRTISGLVLTKLAASASGEERSRLLDRALRHLSRAMVLKAGGSSLQPEMVRDLLFALAECLRMRGDEDRSTRVESVAARVRDGGSWLNPYRNEST